MSRRTLVIGCLKGLEWSKSQLLSTLPEAWGLYFPRARGFPVGGFFGERRATRRTLAG